MTLRRAGVPCVRCGGQIVRLGTAPAACLQCSYATEDDDRPFALKDVEDADERARVLAGFVRRIPKGIRHGGYRL